MFASSVQCNSQLYCAPVTLVSDFCIRLGASGREPSSSTLRKPGSHLQHKLRSHSCTRFSPICPARPHWSGEDARQRISRPSDGKPLPSSFVRGLPRVWPHPARPCPGLVPFLLRRFWVHSGATSLPMILFDETTFGVSALLESACRECVGWHVFVHCLLATTCTVASST